MLVIFVSVLAGTCLFLVPFFLGIMRPPTWRVYSGDGHMYIFNYINNIFKARATHVMHHFSASRYMDLRSASRSMSLHLSALAALSCTTSAQVATWPSMHHFSASRYMALHSANRFMSIQFIVSACRSCSTSLAVAPVASRTWFPYSSARSVLANMYTWHKAFSLTCAITWRKRSR